MKLFYIKLCLLFLICVNKITADNMAQFNKSCSVNMKCGTVPFPSNTGFIPSEPIISSPDVWSFVSEPDLHPMKVQVNLIKSCAKSGLVFVAPYAFSSDPMYGQTGSLILEKNGNPVWFRPLSSRNLMNTDFRVQKLFGKSVLTFWQGTLVTPPAYTNLPGGSSEPGSCYYILDNTYRVIKTVEAQNGFTSDIHEFLITPQGTALLLSTKLVPMDLTPYGGVANGYVQDFAIQEIDLKTDKLLFFWNALEHIPLSDSFKPAPTVNDTSNVWDAYHLNSVGLTNNKNDILVSGRNTWTIYRINKPTQNIVWRLGGKHSNFTFGPGATFSWQHDARLLKYNTISLFDDNCCDSLPIPPGTPYAHGLILKLDLIAMTANVKRTYFHDPNVQVASQGNVQSLCNGNRFIGWGQSQYFSEYRDAGNTVTDPALNTLYAAQMPSNNYTYRAYNNCWIGKPYYSPSIALRVNDNQITLYASWNGSTETAYWQVYAGACPNKLSKVKTVSKTGFETTILIDNPAPYFRVKALNAQCKVIGVSKIVSINAQSTLSNLVSKKYMCNQIN